MGVRRSMCPLADRGLVNRSDDDKQNSLLEGFKGSVPPSSSPQRGRGGRGGERKGVRETEGGRERGRERETGSSSVVCIMCHIGSRSDNTHTFKQPSPTPPTPSPRVSPRETGGMKGMSCHDIPPPSR